MTVPLQQGDVWRVDGPLGGTRTVIVAASTGAIRSTYPGPVPAIPAVETCTLPEHLALAAVQLTTDEFDHLSARVIDLAPTLRKRFSERLGRINAYDLEQIKIALGAIFNM
ncbi:MAG: hypothetical protein J2P26_01840 [Nocardiopsaceae bacterium]|nr:hypothetical protein [Nocardiopsaceae bacterium]